MSFRRSDAEFGGSPAWGEVRVRDLRGPRLGPPPIDPYRPETVAVYRLFNHYGALLYVGISRHPKDRFLQHADDKHWWRYVDHWTVAWYRDRARALAAEAEAIVREIPAYNASGMPATNIKGPSWWRDRFALGYIPKPEDLDELFLTYVRMTSLPDDAIRPVVPEQAFKIYKEARRRASLYTRWLHKHFRRQWQDARDERRRREQIFAREQRQMTRRG